MTPSQAIDTAQSLLNRADSTGWVEVREGVYLNSQESIIADQKSWDDEDGAKNLDFTTSPYWVNTNDGWVVAISDAADLVGKLNL